MKVHFLLAGLVAVGLVASQPDARAHGGGGSGGGGGHGGGGGRSGWHGGWHGGGGFRGHGRFFSRGRFFGPGFAFYGYPWWGWGWGYDGYYPYYSYGGDAYYGGDYDQNDNASAPQYNSTRAVQAALAWRGLYSGRIDGLMGPETESAIRAFQKQQGIPVTGQIDSNLSRALQRRD